MVSGEDSGATSPGYDDTVAELSQDLRFLKVEWGRLTKSTVIASDRLGVIEKSLGMYDTRFDSVDRRFDQLTQILLRMEQNQNEIKSNAMSFEEIPVFVGDAGELRPWISSLETHFACAVYSESSKLALACGVLGGEAKSFVHLLQSRFPFRSWKSLKTSLLYRFGGDDDPATIRLQEQDRRSNERDSHYKAQRAASEFLKAKRAFLSRGASHKVAAVDAAVSICANEFIGTSSTQEMDSVVKISGAEDSLLEEESSKEDKSIQGTCATPVMTQSFSLNALTAQTQLHTSTAFGTADWSGQPQVSISVLESGRREKLLGDFETNMMCKVQKQVLLPIYDDFQSEWAARFDLSTCFKITQCAYQVVDVLHLKKEMMDMKMDKDKLSKSWRFKFKNWDAIEVMSLIGLLKSLDEKKLHDTAVSQLAANQVLHQKVETENVQEGLWSCSIETRDHLYLHSSFLLDELSSAFGSDMLVAHQEEQPYELPVVMIDFLLTLVDGQDRHIAFQMFDNISHKIKKITTMNKQRKGFKSWRFKFKQKRHQRVMSRHEHHLFDRISLRLVCKLKTRCFQGNLRLNSQSIIQFFLTFIFLLRAEVAVDLAHFAFGHKQFVKVAATSYGKLYSSSLLPLLPLLLLIATCHDSGSATVVSLHTSPLIGASTDRQTVAREARICSSPLGWSELRHGTPLVYDPPLYSYSGILHAGASKGVVHQQRLLANVAFLQCVRAMFALATDLSPCIASLGRHKFSSLGSEQVFALPSKATEFKLLLLGSPDSGWTSALISVSGSELSLLPLSTIYIWSRDHLSERLPDGTDRSQEFVTNKEEKEKFALENLAICHHSSVSGLHSFRVMLGDELVNQYLTMEKLLKTWRFKYKQLELLAMIVLERQPAISISLWRAFFLVWYCGQDQLLQQMGIDEGLFHQFIEENTIWSDYALFLLTPVLLLEIRSWESEKDKRQNVIGMMASRLRHNNMLIQLTCNLLLLLLYMAYKTVNTGGHKFFAIWHRWRIRDCVQVVYCIVEQCFLVFSLRTSCI